MKLHRTALSAALASLALPASAVTLSTDGYGQALIFPYYTTRAAEGSNAFNTYLSVTNSAGDAKAVRVRVREGRAGREVLGFNLYLSPNDVWTGAIVPTGNGARLITIDSTCIDPQPGVDLGLPFHANGFTGTNADGLGDTLDRTREGYVEMIEMATVTGQSRDNITHRTTGLVTGCGAMRADPAPSVAPPTGGLRGSLTLINVNNGQDFMVEATALDRLSTRSFFRLPADPYPDFNASEIDPVSSVVHGNHLYRATWGRPVDAVSAALMRSHWMTEYILDNPSASLTDVVVNTPTRHFYLSGTPLPPFAAPNLPLCWNGARGLPLAMNFYNRAQRGSTATTGDPQLPEFMICADTSVTSVRNPGSAHMPSDLERTAVLGSTAIGRSQIRVTSGFQNGWVAINPSFVSPTMASLPGSTRTDLASGTVVTGPQTYVGLPVIGFTTRTFRNGTLTCTSGACQGNYGGAFPMKYRRSISP